MEAPRPSFLTEPTPARDPDLPSQEKKHQRCPTALNLGGRHTIDSPMGGGNPPKLLLNVVFICWCWEVLG